MLNQINSKYKKRRVLLSVIIVLIIAVTAFIWCNSAMAKEDSISFSGGVMEFIKGVIDPDGSMDAELLHRFVRKAAHFTEFFILGALYVLLHKNLPHYKEKLMLLAPFATLLTAVIDEYIQSFSDRGTAVKDVLLDFSGALCAIAVMKIVFFLKEKHQKQ